jgi:hypothetical protein
MGCFDHCHFRTFVPVDKYAHRWWIDRKIRSVICGKPIPIRVRISARRYETEGDLIFSDWDDASIRHDWVSTWYAVHSVEDGISNWLGQNTHFNVYMTTWISFSISAGSGFVAATRFGLVAATGFAFVTATGYSLVSTIAFVFIAITRLRASGG